MAWLSTTGGQDIVWFAQAIESPDGTWTFSSGNTGAYGSGNYGYNSPDSDIWFARRTEHEWPIPRTKYTRFYLGTDYSLSPEKPSATGRLNYDGFKGQPLHFKSSPSKEPMEITGHIIANLVVSVEADDTGKVPEDLDLFITLRHFDADDKEILYTGP